MSETWENLSNASFKGVPFHAAIPSRHTSPFGVESEEYASERRLQFIRRPLVDGADVRDWGANEDVFTVSVEFFGAGHTAAFNKFTAALDNGQAGELILPTHSQSVLAYYWKRTKATNSRDGNALRCTVTWVSATAVQQKGAPGQSTASNPVPPTVDQAKGVLGSALDSVNNVMSSNTFLSAAKLEQTISKVRSAVNAVTTLTQGAISRINTLQAEITGTISQIESAVNLIQQTFSPTASLASSILPQESLGTDSETGQQIISVAAVQAPPAASTPLAQPAATATVTLPSSNLTSINGVQAFATAAVAALSQQQSDLNTTSQGRTEDVSRAITTALVALKAYVAAIVGEAPATYTVPVDMSLGEVLFINGIDVSELRDVLGDNSQIADPFLVPAGTVVTL